MSVERRIEQRGDGVNLPERLPRRLTKKAIAASGFVAGELATLGYGAATGDQTLMWLAAMVSATVGYATVGSILVHDAYDLAGRMRDALNRQPDNLQNK